MSVKRYDFDCYAFYDSARLNVQECDDGDYVLHSDYAALLARHNALETERHSLAQEIMRQVNKNEELHERHDAMREAVAWERECDAFAWWLVRDGKLPRSAAIEVRDSLAAASAEVDRLIASEGADDCQNEQNPALVAGV